MRFRLFTSISQGFRDLAGRYGDDPAGALLPDVAVPDVPTPSTLLLFEFGMACYNPPRERLQGSRFARIAKPVVFSRPAIHQGGAGTEGLRALRVPRPL